MKMIDNLKLEKEILNAYKKDLEQGFINKNTTYQKYRKTYIDKMNKEKITNHNLNILTGFLYQTNDTNKELSSEINNILDLLIKYNSKMNTQGLRLHKFATESVSIKIEGLQESEINITKKSYEGDIFSTYDKIRETKTDNIIINNSSNHKKIIGDIYVK